MKKAMDETVAIESLKQVKKVLDNHGIDYWLDLGTLLGAVRNGKLIGWDSDIDISIWNKDYPKIVSACLELRDKGYTVLFSTQFEIPIKKNGCLISINIYHLTNKNAMKPWVFTRNFLGRFLHHIIFFLTILKFDQLDPNSRPITRILANIVLNVPRILKDNFKKLVLVIDKHLGSNYITAIVPQYYFTNLSTIRFYGMEFNVPTKTEKYLIYRYGREWKVPKKKYRYWEDDGAINTQ